jgi:NlpC/P60 family putative phage cell wall peptidase
MPSRSEITAQARAWVGTPYKHHGREMGRSCDCVGLIVGVGAALDIPDLYPAFDYSAHPKAEKLLTETARVLDEIQVVQPGARAVLRPGNVVAMVVNANREAQHLGIIGEFEGRLSIIHAFNKHERVVEHTLSKWWHDRIVRVYDYPGTTD